MNRMNGLVVRSWCTALVLATLGLGVAGCKKEEPPAPPAPETKPTEPPKPAEPPPPPKPFTAEEQVKFYQDCWGKFNTKAWDDFKKCFSADATSDQVDSGMPQAKGADQIVAGAQMFAKAFPDAAGEAQLILQNGKTTLGVWLNKGTNTGPMMGPGGQEMPATGKKMGILMAHVVTVGDTNQATKEMVYVNYGEIMGQLGVSKMPTRPAMDKGAASPTIVIAKDDETEKKNLETEKAALDAWNKHDVKALTPFYADDLKYADMANPKDQSKKEMLADLGQLYKGMSDVKLDGVEMWAAGDYVVCTGVFTGKNDGPMMNMKPTGKQVTVGYLQVERLEGGKIKESWLFYNSAAMAMQLGMMPAPGAAPAGEMKGEEKGEKKDEKGAEKGEKKKEEKKAPAKGAPKAQ